MSDENVGGLPPLSEEIQGFLNAHPFGYSHALGLLKRYARDAISAHGQPVVDAHLVERILNTRVPGGSLVWWSINGGGMGIDDGHRNVVRRVLEAYLSMKGATT